MKRLDEEHIESVPEWSNKTLTRTPRRIFSSTRQFNLSGPGIVPFTVSPAAQRGPIAGPKSSNWLTLCSSCPPRFHPAQRAHGHGAL